MLELCTFQLKFVIKYCLSWIVNFWYIWFYEFTILLKIKHVILWKFSRQTRSRAIFFGISDCKNSLQVDIYQSMYVLVWIDVNLLYSLCCECAQITMLHFVIEYFRFDLRSLVSWRFNFVDQVFSFNEHTSLQHAYVQYLSGMVLLLWHFPQIRSFNLWFDWSNTIMLHSWVMYWIWCMGYIFIHTPK